MSLFVQPKASGYVHVAWSLRKRSHAKSKLSRNEAFTAGYICRAFNSNVKVMNIKSAGFTQFEKRLLQHLDEM